MRIVFTGGGSLGPVTPLVAIIEAWKQLDPDVEVFWVGTKHGPERALINELGVNYFHIPVVRFTRYPSVEWFMLPFRALWAGIKTWVLLQRIEPDLIVGAGGFTQVPVMILGRMQHIPAWVHKQDAAPLVSNNLVASWVNVTTDAWGGDGNPVRASVLAGSKKQAMEDFTLEPNLPTVLVMGGGGGSSPINTLMESVAGEMIKSAQVVHITGRGKRSDRLDQLSARYHTVEFVTSQMADLLAVADLVIARAGMATITELAALSKPAMLIPLSGTQQEANVKRLQEAVVVVNQTIDPKKFLSLIQELLADNKRCLALGQAIHQALPTDVALSLVRQIKKTLAL